MRWIILVALALTSACGGDGTDGATHGAGAASTTSASGSGGGGGSTFIEGLVSMSIEPADAVLQATNTSAATQKYTVTGKFEGKPDADISDKVDLAVDDAALGVFAGSVFSSSISKGGKTKVTASANAGAIVASTGLTVKLSATLLGPDGGQALPSDPTKSFQGSADPARAPELVYPNDQVLLPPNLKRLEVHYRTGPSQNTLFEIAFTSDVTDIRTYLRCPNPTDGGCIHELDLPNYQFVADSNRGGGPVKLTVRGGDDQATGFGESATFDVTFAEQDVEGGLYYWTTSNDTGIMRFDFGGDALTPEIFLSPTKDGFDTCVGCHALSRDGTKMIASLGGQNDGRLVYLNDLTKPDVFTLKGDDLNRIQFASFNPDGSRFVAIYGDTGLPDRNKLWFHDGATGVRVPAESLDLAFEPDHPDWSPDGAMIALTHVGSHNTSQKPHESGIDLLTKTGVGWTSPVTLLPIVPDMNRYNPSFAPDSTFLVFSESTCPSGDPNSGACDADADDTAKTWGIAPKSGAVPVLLARAGSPGVADQGATDLADTFPRFSPFQQKQLGGRVFWATISSRRRAGLRDPAGQQLLWMFAIDPDKVLAGQDGSAPGFFLPFQDLATSNHIAQWTTVIVTPPPK